MNTTSITDILSATNSLKILWFMLEHPGEEYFDRHISKLTGMSPAGTNLALRELAGAGLLDSTTKGRMVFYRLPTDNPLIHYLKIVQTMSTVHSLIDTLTPNSIRIVLFGSAASGENTAQSDIDLFVLARDTKIILKIASKSTLEKHLQMVVHTPQEWAAIQDQNKVFKEQVEKGITLWDETSQRNSKPR